MDIESEERAKVKERFGKWFEFEEEVKVFSTHWKKCFQVDLLAKPKGQFSELVFAIEVKKKPYWKPANYVPAFKQAYDYCYCIITEGAWKGQVVNSSYVFVPCDGAEFKKGEEDQIKGIEFLAQAFRVGVITDKHAQADNWRGYMKMRNDFWYSDMGFNAHAKGILMGKRQIGSTRKSWAQLKQSILNSNP